MTNETACGFFWRTCEVLMRYCSNVTRLDCVAALRAFSLAVALLLATDCSSFGDQARAEAAREAECTRKCNTLCLSHQVNAYPCRCWTDLVAADCALAKDGAR